MSFAAAAATRQNTGGGFTVVSGSWRTAVISSVNVRDGANLETPTLQGAVMASILNKIRRFLSSPQGRRAMEQGRRYASNPRNRAKLRGLLSRRRRY